MCCGSWRTSWVGCRAMCKRVMKKKQQQQNWEEKKMELGGHFITQLHRYDELYSTIYPCWSNDAVEEGWGGRWGVEDDRDEFQRCSHFDFSTIFHVFVSVLFCWYFVPLAKRHCSILIFSSCSHSFWMVCGGWLDLFFFLLLFFWLLLFARYSLV